MNGPPPRKEPAPSIKITNILQLFYFISRKLAYDMGLFDQKVSFACLYSEMGACYWNVPCVLDFVCAFRVPTLLQYTVCNIYVRIPSIAFPQSCNSNFGSCSCFPPSPDFHVASQGGQRAWSYWLKSCCLNDMKFPFFAKFSLLHFSCWFVLLSLQGTTLQSRALSAN